MKIENLLNSIEERVPLRFSLSFDNTGLLLGEYKSEITGIYVCLDINNKVIDRAINLGANTLISHHPIIFSPLKKIVGDNNKLIKCLKNGINVISYHTNLDAIAYGMNDCFARFMDFDFCSIEILDENKLDQSVGIGRVITLKESMDIKEIIDRVKEKFCINTLRFVDAGVKEVKRVCMINGSGNSMVKDCFDKDIDIVITGDITYHTAFDAIENGVSLIDIGHFVSENYIYKKVMSDILRSITSVSIYEDDVLTDVYKNV